VVAVVDADGGYHLAAECDERIRYSVSTDGGRTWTTTSFKPPANREEIDPQVAVDGVVLYLAYSRIAPNEGCGQQLSDVGVWFRKRTLPSGAWSAPQQLGQTDDQIQGLRVSGGTIYAVVATANVAPTYYETLQGSSYHRYTVTQAQQVAPPSLRVGDDGKARIVYEDVNLKDDTDTLLYGVFTGSGFSTSAIPGSDEGWAPELVLGQGNAAYLLWDRSPQPGGCVTRGPEAADGTYYATNESGTWQTTRLTPSVGAASLTLDVPSGRLFALVSGQGRTPDDTDVPAYDGVFYFTKPAGGSWTVTTLLPAPVSSPVIRMNAATGAILVAYIEVGAGDSSYQIHVMTKDL